MTQAWSVNGAIAVQTQAHNALETAIRENRAVHIFMGNCQITTCASLAAAKLWIGKSKKYRIVPQSAK